MFRKFSELEIYPQLVQAKDDLFYCFKRTASPTRLPEIIEQFIEIEENEQNDSCVLEFCKKYEGLFYEKMSERYIGANGYVIVWVKTLEGIELRDRVVSGDIK